MTLLMMVIYHQTKTPISFWYRRGLNPRSFIQLLESLLVELTRTHVYLYKYILFYFFLFFYFLFFGCIEVIFPIYKSNLINKKKEKEGKYEGHFGHEKDLYFFSIWWGFILYSAKKKKKKRFILYCIVFQTKFFRKLKRLLTVKVVYSWEKRSINKDSLFHTNSKAPNSY